MGLDITNILSDWPYEPGQITARRIRGADGKSKIQLRLDLGLLQMEAEGRPDGKRPHGYESLLDYHEHLLRRWVDEHGSDEGFDLDEQACELLRGEGVMYYHRYLAEFVLEDYESVERDAMRNVRAFDLCRRYARDESDKYALEQYRPYVIMMIARARARLALKQNRPKTALASVRKGIKDIEDFCRQFGQEDAIESSGEIAILKAMVSEIEARIPADPMQKLKEALDKAVTDERYEEAAQLRDQLRRATEQSARLSQE
ncbi:MAG: UvrB/UvrC motif-containing protein [Planctomycetaceae bacterium]|nr:UvrB/UvrC motif-containing protein [Planctomycetaceae bacterium]